MATGASQSYSAKRLLALRSAGGEVRTLAESLRREIRALDGTLPVHALKTMESHLGFALLPARLTAGSVTGFAVLALLMAAVGLYGTFVF